MRSSIFLVFAFFFSTLTLGQSLISPFQYSIQKSFSGRNGAVVSAHPLASQVGVAILKKGGNAVDAAIAVQLALSVVYPGAGNIGGGGFMVIHLNNGKNTTLDFREKAPLKSHRDMYLDTNGTASLEKSQNGHLAAGVPGTVAGIFLANKYGKLPMTALIQPAIDLAEHGFILTSREAANLNKSRPDFVRYNTRPIAFVKTEPWKAGDTLFQPELANTLKRIRDFGQKGFYEGETARLIVEEMQRGNGMISMEDLKSYTAIERAPVRFSYAGHDIITMPLPSSGGVLLPMMMKMTAHFPIRTYGFHSLKAVQLMTEIERLAYADRSKFLGDPDFIKVPIAQLTSEEYITSRLRLYHPDSAGNSLKIQAGILTPEKEETTHFSILDKDGNAASVTTTLNGSYGAYTVVGSAGFLLNNEMDDFSIKPGVPNMYGAVGGEANAIAPGKRMLSSMTPIIVLKRNKATIVAGTPGGTTITTSVYQTLINLLDFNLSTADAVNKPKFHMQWLPDTVFVEADFPDEIIAGLKKMGYTVSKRGNIGRTEVIKVLDNGTIEAIGDKRGDDAAEGY